LTVGVFPVEHIEKIEFNQLKQDLNVGMCARKLTLKLEKSVIGNAKKYARENHQSLPKMVEEYFQSITQEPTPIVNSLAGILSKQDTRDSKADYTVYLAKKYSV
jgi:hypothetical protein